MKNSVDPDQLAPPEASCSCSEIILFEIGYIVKLCAQYAQYAYKVEYGVINKWLLRENKILKPIPKTC